MFSALIGFGGACSTNLGPHPTSATLDSGAGPFATGAHFTLSAEFDLRTGAAPFQKDPPAGCNYNGADFVFSSGIGSVGAAGPSAVAETLDCGDITLAPLHDTSKPCVLNLSIVCKAKHAGQYSTTMSAAGSPPNDATAFDLVTVIDPDRVSENLAGYPTISLLPGVLGYFEVSAVDKTGAPLRGGLASVNGTAPADLSQLADITPWPLWGGFFIGGKKIGSSPVTLSSDLGLQKSATITIVDPASITGLRFFRINSTPLSTDFIWSTLQWTPIPSDTLIVKKGDDFKLIAAAVDAAGNPIWIGQGSIGYTLDQLPAVSFAPRAMTTSYTNSSSTTVIGTDWLAASALAVGKATVTASGQGKTATLTLSVE